MRSSKNNASAIRASAAAGIAACSLAGAAQAAEIEWLPGPSELVGAYIGYRDANNREVVLPTEVGGVDLDGDGLFDFSFYFYHGFQFGSIIATYPEYNFTAEVMASYDTSEGRGSAYGETHFFSGRTAVYAAAMSYEPVERGGSLYRLVAPVNSLSGPAQQATVGLVFTGGDGNRYVGYIDIIHYAAFLGPQQSNYAVTLAITDFGYTKLGPYEPQPGDTNGDLDIDLADTLTAIANFTGSGSYTRTAEEGDTDQDGDVDEFDLIFFLSEQTAVFQSGGIGVSAQRGTMELQYFEASGELVIDTDGQPLTGYSITGDGLVFGNHEPVFDGGETALNQSESSVLASLDLYNPNPASGVFSLGEVLPAGLTFPQVIELLNEMFYVPNLGGGIFEFDLVYQADSGVIGDTDNDGDVDDFDLIAAIVNYTGSLPDGTGGMSVTQGETDGDGDVDDFDLINMIIGYTGSLPASPATVPEPSSLGLLVLAGAGLLARRRRA